MKQNFARTLCILLVLISFVGAARLFADENTVNLESVVVQNFSDAAAQNWFVIGSKFATSGEQYGTKGFPRLSFVKAWPQSLYGYETAGKDIRSLGVALLFDRKEYNWVDIIPGTKTGGDATNPTWAPSELPLPGRVRMIDLWVWSGNLNYYMEAFVRDYTGIVHTIPLGDLNFVGWKNLRVNIPESVPQSHKYLPKRENLTLVKFRIWTRPTEIVALPIKGEDPKAPADKNSQAYKDWQAAMASRDISKATKFYFNNIKVLTDTFESLYDGDNLTQPSVLKDAWGSSGNK